MSRANDVVTRLALAEAAADAVKAEVAALSWTATVGVASAAVMPNGDLDLRGGFVTPSDALALARFLNTAYGP